MKTTDRDRLLDVGKCAMGALSEMVAALTLEWDRLEELREERADLTTAIDDAEGSRETLAAHNALSLWDAANLEELAELKEAAGDCTDGDDARQRIAEDPLSLEYTGTWAAGEDPRADGFVLLLSTGGPAVRIIGDLNSHGEPCGPVLQAQDWFLPWTEVAYDPDTLQSYCDAVGICCE